MVGKVIRDHIEGGAKRLTVPGFGTFMRRDEGGVIFVDLLRSDDGMLREMVEDRGGYSEVEAMALIDRFIFETKNSIEHEGSATINGFGTMRLDHKGVYQFDHSPKARPVKEHAVQERLFGNEAPRADRPARAAGSQRSGPRRGPSAGRSVGKPQRGRSSRADTILIVAIAAAAIAIVAMIFGMSSGNMPFLQK